MDKLPRYDHQVMQKQIALGEAESLASTEALLPAWSQPKLTSQG